MSPKVIVATWNVNSVLARLDVVLRWLKHTRPDALCLQEVKCTEERFPAAEFAGAGYHTVVNGQPTYNGVAVLSRHETEDVRRGMPHRLDPKVPTEEVERWLAGEALAFSSMWRAAA